MSVIDDVLGSCITYRYNTPTSQVVVCVIDGCFVLSKNTKKKIMMNEAQQQDMTNTAATWSISVKTVGQADERDDVTVQVCPDDHVRSLYDKIETATGVKASQQRLIYRGRLIADAATTTAPATTRTTTAATSETAKIKDIDGLQDGHTIHLVRKREHPDAERAESTNSDVTTNNNNSSSNNGGSSDSSGSNSSNGSGFLAALLGLSSANNTNAEDGGGDEEEEEAENNNSSSSSDQQPRTASLRRFGSSRRRFHYRLTADDFRVRDPGSMEHVRQGLLTLHTMLPPAMSAAAVSDPTQASPLDLPRQWYIGQWVDVRDTVNQWLEATIIDICTPDELLPHRSRGASAPLSLRQQPQTPTLHAPNDPIVTASDLEGRLRLLVEPCCGEDRTNDNNEDLGGNLAGFRQRDNNDGVQLLLIHYNGWPDRWDEWIRSDSERIRPFRVRTRHPSTSTTALPSPVSHYAETPPTHIRAADNEVEDRFAMLPELSRLLDTVNDMMSHAAAAVADRSTPEIPLPDPDRLLPWIPPLSSPPSLLEQQQQQDNEDDEDEEQAHVEPAAKADEEEEDDKDNNDRSERNENNDQKNKLTSANRRQLEALVPLLDRLGRTLIDASPHVAALAASIPDEESSSSTHNNGSSSNNNNNSHGTLERIEENTNTLGGLLSLLNRDRRRRNQQEDNSNDNPRRSARRRQSNDSSNMAVSSVATEEATTQSNSTTGGNHMLSFDPDYTDFASGVVNTTRGEVRSGPRSRRSANNSASDEVASLLGAYLAAASLASITGDGDDNNNNNNNNVATGLGRLFRDTGGGGGGGGIDIHIHAVVTAPGGAGGGGTVGILTPMGGGGTATLGAADLAGITTAAAATTTTTNNNNNNSPGTTFANLFSSHRNERRATGLLTTNSTNASSRAEDEEDMGIFDELYSETPDPVDPSANPVSSSATSTPSPTAPNESHRTRHEESSSNNASTNTSPMRRSRHRLGASRNSSSRSGSSSTTSRGGNMWSRMFRRPPSDRSN